MNRKSRQARLALKTRLLAAVVILANVLGNFFLSLGLRERGFGSVPLRYAWISVGVAILIVWLLSRLALLSWADLSYVLPVTAAGYLLLVLMGRVFLNEQVSALRWAGTVLIVLGIALVSKTAIRTVKR